VPAGQLKSMLTCKEVHRLIELLESVFSTQGLEDFERAAREFRTRMQ
jgi:hypothetical protein